MADVEARLAALEAQVNALADQAAIRRLQMAYGYYIDYNRPEEVAGLFADDGAVVFLSGEYRGHAGVMRLYGTWFQNLFTGGRRGPVKGLLLDHFQLQDVIATPPKAGSAAFWQAAGTTRRCTKSPRGRRSSSGRPGSMRTTMFTRTGYGRSSGSTT
jgi:hypothetical protein